MVGSYSPGTTDGSALSVARKGNVVVVVMALVCGDLARTAQSEADHLNTAPILEVPRGAEASPVRRTSLR